MDEYPKQYLYRQIVRAKLFIDANYSSAIDLDNIADAACFSKFHFVRLFKQIYDKTPHQYLTNIRIDRAVEMLEDGFSVKKTCFAVGFDSVSSFTGLFKRRIRRSPAAFQRERSLRKEEMTAIPLKHIPNCFAEKKGWTKISNFREIETIDANNRAAR
jgi:transcriptional regulator GlxA family with amidase domain